MRKVTLSDYTVVYSKTIGEALEKAFKLGQKEHFDLHDSTLTERKLAALEYIKNMPNYSYRWVDRRELNK